MSYRTYYQCGGALLPEHETYIERETDRILYESLKKGELCYVFNSRQMGKSTTANSVMEKFRLEGINFVYIDMTEMITKEDKRLLNSKQITQKQVCDIFYDNLVEKLWEEFQCPKSNYTQWIEKYKNLQTSKRKKLQDFFEQVLLNHISGKVIIFLDEIDSLFDLIYLGDDLFTLIRIFYNQQNKYSRLIFCLLGVATSDELIKSAKTTPFNIGENIELSGFTFEQVREPLGRGLTETVDNPNETLKEILEWTKGQPFLTQKLCSIVVRDNESRNPDIKALVEEHFIRKWENSRNQTHFTYIRTRILKNNPKQLRNRLNLYQKILQSEDGIKSDNSPEQMELRLTGLVRKDEKKLKIFNPIYKEIFDLDWVESELNKLSVKKEVKKTLFLVIDLLKNKLLESRIRRRIWRAFFTGINASIFHFVLLSIELPLATLITTFWIPDIFLVLFLVLMIFKHFRFNLLEFLIFSNFLLIALLFAPNFVLEHSIWIRGLFTFVFGLVLLSLNIFITTENH